MSNNIRSKAAWWQTLTTLKLSGTDGDGIGIGDEGAKHLANALKINRVSDELYSLFNRCLRSQSLTTLEIDRNGIGSEGAQALAIARIINEVSHCLYSFTWMSFFITDMQSSGMIGFLDLLVNKVWSHQESVETKENVVDRRERRSPMRNPLRVLDSFKRFTVKKCSVKNEKIVFRKTRKPLWSTLSHTSVVRLNNPFRMV